MRDEGFMFPREHRIKLKKNDYIKMMKLVHERDNNQCIICGDTWHVEVHHVKFRSAYASDTIDNLVCICKKCHDIYCHGVKEKGWQASLREYLDSKKCRDFNALHKKQIDAIYSKYKD